MSKKFCPEVLVPLFPLCLCTYMYKMATTARAVKIIVFADLVMLQYNAKVATDFINTMIIDTKPNMRSS